MLPGRSGQEHGDLIDGNFYLHTIFTKKFKKLLALLLEEC